MYYYDQRCIAVYHLQTFLGDKDQYVLFLSLKKKTNTFTTISSTHERLALDLN